MNEIVVPRLPEGLGALGPKWKVTARFSVQLSPAKSVACVRVRCGIGPSYHFSESLFKELFRQKGER